MTYDEVCHETIPDDTQDHLMKFAGDPLSVSATVPLDDGGTFALISKPDSLDLKPADSLVSKPADSLASKPNRLDLKPADSLVYEILKISPDEGC